MTISPMTPSEAGVNTVWTISLAGGGLILAWVVSRAMRAIGALLERRTPEALDERIVAALRGPLAWALALFLLVLAAKRWPWDAGTDALLARAAAAVVTFAAFYASLRVVGLLLGWYASRTHVEQSRTIASLLSKIIGTIIWVLGLLIVLDQLGYKVGPMLASLGIAGVAIGLGMQQTLSNLFAGIYVMLDRTLATGDYVHLSSGEEGFVERVGWRSTWFRTSDGQEVIVPNVTIASATMRKLDPPGPEPSEREATITGRAAYGADLDRLEQACLAAAREVTQAQPSFRVTELAAGGAGFELTTKGLADEVPRLEHDLRKAVYSRLQSEGIRLA
jgi:small-conductance mechanosensitive channel